jgi:hypothetical protein
MRTGWQAASISPLTRWWTATLYVEPPSSVTYTCMYVCVYMSECLPIATSMYVCMNDYLSVAVYVTSSLPQSPSSHRLCFTYAYCMYVCMYVCMSSYARQSLDLCIHTHIIHAYTHARICARVNVVEEIYSRHTMSAFFDILISQHLFV